MDVTDVIVQKDNSNYIYQLININLTTKYLNFNMSNFGKSLEFSHNILRLLGPYCYNIIANKLSYIDLLALIYSCKDHYKHIETKLLSGRFHIERYMINHNYQYDNFLARLSPECIIYGGFMFHVIMNTCDKESDIDIIHYQQINDEY
jgi:hypothetical protein